MVQTQKSVKGMGVYQCLDEGISWISCPKTKFLYVRCKWLEENKDKKVEYSLQKVLYPFFFFLTLSCDIAQKMPKKMLISPITKKYVREWTSYVNLLHFIECIRVFYVTLKSESTRVGNSGSRVEFGSTRLTRLYKRVNPNPTWLLIG